MPDRLMFPIAAAVVVALMVAMNVADRSAAERFRARATAAGHATTQLAIREIG